ncbi:hypothetical protein KEM56_006180 [Ascosphaera pollenicola]|nr:hypothetical protein KEM56_006180 [Ascosphaera pollenicola]
MTDLQVFQPSRESIRTSEGNDLEVIFADVRRLIEVESGVYNDEPKDDDEDQWVLDTMRRAEIIAREQTIPYTSEMDEIMLCPPPLRTQVMVQSHGFGLWNLATFVRDLETLRPRLSVQYVHGGTMENLWHPAKTDLIDFCDPKTISYRIFEATYMPKPQSKALNHQPCEPGTRVVIKLGWKDDDLHDLQKDADMYQILNPLNIDFIPKFLGHIYEGDNVVGYILEKITPRTYPTTADVQRFEETISRFHELGFVHGHSDADYLILANTDHGPRACMVDFSKTKRCDPSDRLYDLERQQEITFVLRLVKSLDGMIMTLLVDIGQIETVKARFYPLTHGAGRVNLEGHAAPCGKRRLTKPMHSQHADH